MITKVRRAAAVAAVAVGLAGGGVAAADQPAEDVTTYSCDALTSADVPAVKKRLKDQGIDVSKVDGPVGLACRKTTGDGDGVAASVTGVDGVAFRCASAEEKNSTKVVFFVDCGQSAPNTDS